jgi:type I restriction-modification system DNA methylase subunit
MKLTQDIKEKIIKEFKDWENIQYGNLTKAERDELGAFFTPPEITIKMIESYSCDSLWGKTILDPTIGAGGLIAACIIAGADPKLCYGNEFDSSILEICKKRLCAIGVPEENLHLGDATNPESITLDSFTKDYKVKWNKKNTTWDVISKPKTFNRDSNKETLW